MRYGYATIALPTLTPEEAGAELVAAGFAGVEWMVGTAPHAAKSSAETLMVGNRCALPLDRDAVAEASRRAREQGLDIIGLGPYVRSGDLDGLEQTLEIAVAAGAPQIRLQPPRRDAGSILDSRTAFVRFLSDALPLLRRSGVSIAAELHQLTIAPSVGLMLPLIEAFDPELVGVIYDVGNLVVEGFEDDRMSLELLGPRLHHVHLKNARVERVPGGRRTLRWVPLDEGQADVGGFLLLLQERGYDRWISIEDLSNDTDSSAAIRANAAALQKIGAPGWLPSRSTTRRM